MIRTNAATCLAASFAILVSSGAFASTDITKLVQKSDVESALGGSFSEPAVKELPAPLGGKQINFTGNGLPVKTYSLSVRTDADVAPPLKASGMTAAKMYQQAKAMWSASGKIEPLVIKGGEGFSSGNTTAILKNGIYMSAITLFGGSKQAAAARNALTLKAADRL